MVKLVTSSHQPEKAEPIHDNLTKPHITPKDFKSAVIDTRETRLDHIIRYADGGYTSVSYFRQLLGSDDSLSMHSKGLSSVQQQYELIGKMQIKLQGSISATQSQDETRATEITVDAYLDPFIIPNVGDIILMDIGRGTLGWFNVTGTRRMSHRRNTLYEINLTLAYEIRDQLNDEKLTDLNRKVVRELVYSDEYRAAGQDPLLTPKKADTFKKLHHAYHRLNKLWFRKFYNRFYETCFLPNQSLKVYDGFFMRTIAKWLSVGDHPELMYWRTYDDDEFPILRNPSLWDALTEQDKHMLRECFSRSVLLGSQSFTPEYQLSAIRYSDIDAVICPVESPYTNNVWLFPVREVGKVALPTPSINNVSYKVIDGVPIIHQVLLKDAYVLSRSFWLEDYEGMSHLEVMVHKYLDQDPIDAELLLQIVEDTATWAEQEKYYYLPILTMLINYTVRVI